MSIYPKEFKPICGEFCGNFYMQLVCGKLLIILNIKYRTCAHGKEIATCAHGNEIALHFINIAF